MATQEIDDFTEDTAPADGDLLVSVDISDTTDSPQGTTKKLQHQNLVVKKVRTSTGPTVLTVGAVGDGEVLKRSGTSIVGAAVGGGGVGDVVGPSSSVDSEIALFDSTTGKLIKRATTTGLLKATSGVIAAATAGTDYVSPTAVMNDQTGTTYTIQASDNGKVITCSNASAITVTVPSGLGVGFNCMVIQKGAGQVTFSPSSSTVNNRQSHTKIAGQYGVVSLIAYVADVFVLAGDTST